MMKTILIILFCGLACALSAQKVLIVQNLRWPEIQKIFVGASLTYELRDDDGNRYTRKIVDIFPERNSILLGELEVPISEIKRIEIRNHVGWGYFKKARRLLASYAPSSVFIPPSNSQIGIQQPTMVSLNFLTIGGMIITRTRDVRIGGNFRLQAAGY